MAEASRLVARALRLRPGDDLRRALQREVRDGGIAAGAILTCVGSLSQTRLRLPAGAGEPERLLELDEPVEIVSLCGTLGMGGLHLHMAVSRSDGSCVGGHVMEGCVVRTTAEIVVGHLPDLVFGRAPDAATGYLELEIARARAP